MFEKVAYNKVLQEVPIELTVLAQALREGHQWSREVRKKKMTLLVTSMVKPRRARSRSTIDLWMM